MAADSTDSTASPPSTRMATWLALGALCAAAAPHFFLDPPLAFYDAGNTNAWLGLTVWSPTFLSAIALFAGVDAGATVERPLVAQADVRLAAAVATPIAVLAALAALRFDGYQHVGSWSTLGLAMIVYGGVFAVGCFFWQGLLQRRVLAGLPGALRPLVVAALGAALWLPFLAGHPWAEISSTLVEYTIVYVAVAILFELGLSVFGCMAVALLMGVAWAWAHQMTFF